jgi:hypothetical protein
MTVPSPLKPPFLGRWCLPLGKWAGTCRPAVKARFADADNSVWERGPLNADGEEVRPVGHEKGTRHASNPETRKNVNRGDKAE